LLQRCYPPSSPIRTHPPPSRLGLTSRFCGYRAYLSSAISRPGRGGLLQLLSRSLFPCCHYRPAGVYTRFNQFSSTHAAFTSRLLVRPPNFQVSRSPVCSLTLRPGNLLTTLMAALSLDSRGSVSFPPANQATGLWLLPWQVYFLLNTPAFAGHTTVPLFALFTHGITKMLFSQENRYIPK